MALRPRENFSYEIGRFAAQTRENVNAIVRKATLDIFVKVVLRTPVDTGRARGNWLPSFGRPEAGFDWDRKSPDGSATVARVAAFALSMKAGQVAYLTNNLPYIVELEFFGKSRQAPEGMARLTVREYADYLSRTGIGILRAI